MKRQDLVVSIVAGAIAIGWILTTFSVQHRLQQRSSISNNVHQLVK